MIISAIKLKILYYTDFILRIFYLYSLYTSLHLFSAYKATERMSFRFMRWYMYVYVFFDIQIFKDNLDDVYYIK